MQEPNTLGIVKLTDINLREIVPFINWTFFFRAWKITGKYVGIETICECSSCETAWLTKFTESEREKANEALKLFRDAQGMLRRFLVEEKVRINAIFGLFPAYSNNDDIIIRHENRKIVIPTLRQQQPADDGFCYSLADFINIKDDYIGVFANTVLGAEELSKEFELKDDIYCSILTKTLADRLAEATSEWLHFQIRKKYWGYNPDEKPNVKTILKNKYPGIRPAIGYPSLPDQSIIFELSTLLKPDEIGIKLTENGAMSPNSSICGLYFSHPESRYFMIGKIDDDQLSNYAARRGKTTDEIKKWLVSNIK